MMWIVMPVLFAVAALWFVVRIVFEAYAAARLNAMYPELPTCSDEVTQ